MILQAIGVERSMGARSAGSASTRRAILFGVGGKRSYDHPERILQRRHHGGTHPH